jgi:alpha-tubulin suppressor-like RCC1 family protein
LRFVVFDLDLHATADSPSHYRFTSDPSSSLSGYSAVAIALGQYHTCVIVSGGGVKCWGYNGYGQLGNGDTSTQYYPADVSLGGML